MSTKILSGKALVRRERIGITGIVLGIIFVTLTIINILILNLQLNTVKENAYTELESYANERMTNYLAPVDTPKIHVFSEDEYCFFATYDTTLDEENRLVYISNPSDNQKNVLSMVTTTALPTYAQDQMIGNTYTRVYSPSAMLELLNKYSTTPSSEESITLKDSIYYFCGIDKETNITAVYSFSGTLLMTFIVAFILIVPVIWWISDNLTQPTVTAMAQEKEFVANASHELKTPLAIIMAEADLLKGRNPESGELTDLIIRQCKNMNDTVIDMIALSKLETDMTPPERVEIGKMLNDTCLSLDAVAFENGIFHFDYTGIDKTLVLEQGYYRDIQRMFNLLIDNAIKYTEGEKVIKIELKKEKNRIHFVIYNTGCQVPDSDREKMFERFYQGKTGSDKERKGSGLGLAVVKEICDKHNYRLSIDSKFHEYMRMEIVY